MALSGRNLPGLELISLYSTTATGVFLPPLFAVRHPLCPKHAHFSAEAVHFLRKNIKIFIFLLLFPTFCCIIFKIIQNKGETMLYIFLALSLGGAVVLVHHWCSLALPTALWQFPAAFLGCFAALILLFLLILFFSCILVDMRKQVKRPSRYFLFLLHQFCRLSFFLGGVTLHTEGLEKVPTQGRFMMVSNHLLALDPMLFYHAFPNIELSFIAKKESFSFYIVSQIMHQILCLPIDRENDREALKSVLKAIEFLKEDRTSIAVFPEGYTSKTGQLQPFRNGTFKIAQKASVPIVVCTISNTRPILKNMFRRHTDVFLTVHEVIPAEELAGKTTIEIGSRVHKIMEDGIAARQRAER